MLDSQAVVNMCCAIFFPHCNLCTLKKLVLFTSGMKFVIKFVNL